MGNVGGFLMLHPPSKGAPCPAEPCGDIPTLGAAGDFRFCKAARGGFVPGADPC